MFGSFEAGGTAPVDDFKEQIVHYVSQIVLFLASTIMFLIGLRRLLPEDLFSTALFFDSLEIAKVFDSPARLSDDQLLGSIMHLMAYDFQDVTVSAMSVSLFLFTAQMIAGYFVVIQGEYAPGYKSFMSYMSAWVKEHFASYRGERKTLPRMNPDKVAWLWFWVVLASADTLTDIIFRSNVNGEITMASAFWSIVVSILVYNLGSEWATVLGFSMVVSSGHALLVRTWPLIVTSYNSVYDFLGPDSTGSPRGGNQQKNRHGNKQQKQRQQQQQHQQKQQQRPQGQVHVSNDQRGFRSPQYSGQSRSAVDQYLQELMGDEE